MVHTETLGLSLRLCEHPLRGTQLHQRNLLMRACLPLTHTPPQQNQAGLQTSSDFYKLLFRFQHFPSTVCMHPTLPRLWAVAPGVSTPRLSYYMRPGPGAPKMVLPGQALQSSAVLGLLATRPSLRSELSGAVAASLVSPTGRGG